MLRDRFVRGLLLAAVCAVAVGCGSMRTEQVPEGIVYPEGASIRAENDAWKLEGGQWWVTPFSVDAWWDRAPGLKEKKLVDQASWALQRGAQRVRVGVPRYQGEFYGVLLLNRVGPDARGPASRSYKIDLTEDRVANATDGRISVMYEYVDVEKNDKVSRWYSWILWMSDRPVR